MSVCGNPNRGTQFNYLIDIEYEFSGCQTETTLRLFIHRASRVRRSGAPTLWSSASRPMSPSAHTRCDAIENELRDDLAQMRRAMYQRDREIVKLKKQIAQLQSVPRPPSCCRCLRGCLLRLARALCPCCTRPAIGMALLADENQNQKGAGPQHAAVGSMGRNTSVDLGV